MQLFCPTWLLSCNSSRYIYIYIYIFFFFNSKKLLLLYNDFKNSNYYLFSFYSSSLLLFHNFLFIHDSIQNLNWGNEDFVEFRRRLSKRTTNNLVFSSILVFIFHDNMTISYWMAQKKSCSCHLLTKIILRRRWIDTDSTCA